MKAERRNIFFHCCYTSSPRWNIVIQVKQVLSEIVILKAATEAKGRNQWAHDGDSERRPVKSAYQRSFKSVATKGGKAKVASKLRTLQKKYHQIYDHRGSELAEPAKWWMMMSLDLGHSEQHGRANICWDQLGVSLQLKWKPWKGQHSCVCPSGTTRYQP